jgi:hypothetical protein
VQQALAQNPDPAREKAVEPPDGVHPRLEIPSCHPSPPYAFAIGYNKLALVN